MFQEEAAAAADCARRNHFLLTAKTIEDNAWSCEIIFPVLVADAGSVDKAIEFLKSEQRASWAFWFAQCYAEKLNERQIEKLVSIVEGSKVARWIFCFISKISKMNDSQQERLQTALRETGQEFWIDAINEYQERKKEKEKLCPTCGHVR